MMIVSTLLIATASPTIDPWLRLELDGVYAKAEVLEGDDDIDASAIIGEATAGVALEWDDTQVAFSALTEFVEFADRDFTDRFRHRSRVELTHDIDERWEMRLRADRSLRFPSAEFFDIDETELRGRIRFEPAREHRFGVAFRWRERSYNDGTSSHGDGPRIEGEYRHRLGRYHYLELEARHEEINSGDLRRNYTRQAGAVTYTYPLSSDIRLRPKIAYRRTEYPGRIGLDGIQRDDRQWTPEIEFLWWPGEWRTSAEFQYQWRDSTDPDRANSGPRMQVTVAHVF